MHKKVNVAAFYLLKRFNTIQGYDVTSLRNTTRFLLLYNFNYTNKVRSGQVG